MKRIAFFVQWMLCGGVENALIALSRQLADRGNEVTIYVIKNQGEFIQKIPNEVRLLEIPMEQSLRNSIPVGGSKITIRQNIEEKKYFKALKFAVRHKLNKTPFAELNVDLDKIPILNDSYDIAVNYHMHSPFLVWYLSERVKADKKYTWIHNDFSTTKYDIALLKEYLGCVDHFYAVSNQLKEEFIERIPEFAKKTDVALNIVPVDDIEAKAMEFYPEEYSNTKALKILTVGRLEEQKGYDLAIEVCKKLKDDGNNILWFALGDGTLKERLENLISSKGLNTCFYLLGNKLNPYPYFKNCDLYIQTSRHEGYVTTVSEAKIFDRPIVTTDVSGAKEQINSGENGFIVEINADSIYEKVKILMDSEEIRDKFTSNLSKSENIDSQEWLSAFN